MEVASGDERRTHEALLWILRLAFGCRHRQMSRVFTIKQRTYKVRSQCEREFECSDCRPSVQRCAIVDVQASME